MKTVTIISSLLLWLYSACLLAATNNFIATNTSTEIFGLYGPVFSDDAHSTAWNVGYIYRDQWWGYKIKYLNEGHFAGHYRDGVAGQALGNIWLVEQRLLLSAGIGPYWYFDTQFSHDATTAYINHQGLGIDYTLAATWYNNPWLFKLGLDHIKVPGSISTTALGIGFGYQFEKVTKLSPGTNSQQDLAVLVGRNVVNSVNSSQAFAQSLEYRYSLTPHINWSVAYLHEGNTNLVKRDGVATEFWLSDDLIPDRLTAAIGAGPYLLAQSRKLSANVDENSAKIAALLSVSVNYYFNNPWLLRMIWHRVITSYDRNSDIFLLGTGARF